MALNWSTDVYLPNYNVFARPITVNPLASQPGEPTYTARGIYNTQILEVAGMDGSVISTHRTIIDILETEFTVLPLQGDHVTIPESVGMPALGEFEVLDSHQNGGGETTLTLQKVVVAKP